jgi:amino acid transporter
VTGLRRALGTWDLVWFLVTAVVGLRWIAVAAASGPGSLVLWLVALLAFYVPLAFAVIALSERHPVQGGLYVWVRLGLGEFAGFMAGWMYWMSTVVYFNGLLYFGAGAALFVLDPTGRTWSDSPAWFVGVSLTALALALGLNVVGWRAGRWLHLLGGWSTWLPVAAIVALSTMAAVRFGPATPFTAASLVPAFDLGRVTFWSTLAFAFGGFEAVAFMSEEIHDPARTVRRAVILGGAIIAAIYLLGTAALLVALPPSAISGLQGVMQGFAAVAARTGWPALTPILGALIAVGTLGGASAWLASTARLPYVAGVDRVLPAAFARLHPRFGTPWMALATQAGVSAVLAGAGQLGTSVAGAYDVLVSLGVISYFIPYLLLFTAMWRLDRRAHARLLAAVALAVTALSVVLAAVPSPQATGRGWVLLKVVGGSAALAAWGAWLYWRSARRRSGPSAA